MEGEGAAVMARGSAWRLQQAAEGKCIDCHQARPDVTGRTPRCGPCRAAFNGWRKRRYAARKHLGVCPCCGIRLGWWDDDEGRQYTLCQRCLGAFRQFAERRKAVTT
jgi:hypothetical protein